MDNKYDFLKRFSSEVPQKSLVEFFRGEEREIILKGLYGSSKACAFSGCVESVKKGVHIVIFNNTEQAKFFTSDLYTLLSEENVFYFPTSANKNVKLSTIKEGSNKVQRSAAINAINNFKEGKGGLEYVVLVTYPEALFEKIIDRKSLQNNILKIAAGNTLSHEFIKETLALYNFEKVDFVSGPGEYALRGGIIDLFSYSDDRPYRIDFFGNRVESIKYFDINTQRSTESLESVEIFPDIYDRQKFGDSDYVTIFEYAGEECVVWIDNYVDMAGESFNEVIKSAINLKTLYFEDYSMIGGQQGQRKELPVIKFETEPQPPFNKNFGLLLEDIEEKTLKGYSIYISSDNPRQIERLRSIFAHNYGDDLSRVPAFGVINSSIHAGFINNSAKICLYTDHQIFDRFHRVKVKREVQASERLTINELNAFKIGDYVVHIDHGVGIFGGLVKTNVNGKVQEAIKLIYKDNDVIFVSIHGIHRIARYKSKDSTPPKIYKLGSGAWEKLKRSTKSKVKDMAKELIKLYAQRQSVKGFAFSGDTYLQHELEASFMYEDTPDQLKATRAVKEDMEKPYPMDRLVCADVGFGKTEVAIRAAFKAVADSKQVVVLVPTTILALQHYKTFSGRLEKFPCNVEFLSRLKSAKEIKEVTEKLKSGKIDIIIGTHRLLNKSIEFKDLGLLIIDEEQKFGVAAKERLRQLKLSVDTLTLTATPIPRTLQFSLLGARDLSIINTPPPNRLPVQTEIIDFNEDVIRDAIMVEIERGGQVFFVHNRVEDILAIEEIIKRICPGVKTCVGHGQMEAKELETKMLDFIMGDYDVLIATSIIENGIDVPNVNTIIVNQAQNFGLSDLHQLRGRVGRSNIKAFCYLIVPPMVSITDDARRRLKAIEAFSDLGSGFNIAMQDLDIRGAGNLLGGEQSGFVADMGFETYQRILSEAFMEIKEEEGEESGEQTAAHRGNYLNDCVVDTDLELLIPDEYISQVSEKIRLYKELDAMSEEREIAEFIASLKDRFGELPEQLVQLINVVRLKREAIALGFERIVIKNDLMLAYFISNQSSDYYKSALFADILNYINGRRRDFRIKEQNNRLFLRVEGVKSMEKAFNLLLGIREGVKQINQ